MQPRYREFLPLATQQLRLRNLVKIQGQNIQCNIDDDPDAHIFYTLHSTMDSTAFYTSEALPNRHSQQKWADIVSTEMQKSNSKCVCVKVWYRRSENTNSKGNDYTDKERLGKKCCIKATKIIYNNFQLSSKNDLRPPDILLFTWGVYLSGLILLDHFTDAKCCLNALIFQINGDFFTSPEYCTTECLRDQITSMCKRYPLGLTTDTVLSQNDEFSINSPQVSRRSSPVTFHAEPNLIRLSKSRYSHWFCASKDIRMSYDQKKLLQGQNIQREILQKKRDSEAIASEIRRLSLYCITSDQLMLKPRTTSASYSHSSYNHNSNHSMGRTLSVLLSEQQQIHPKVLLRAQQLKQQIETVQCREQFLQTEVKTYSRRVQQLRQKLEKLKKFREQQLTSLHNRKCNMQNIRELLEERHQELVDQQQTKRLIMQGLECRVSTLCMELFSIYPISRRAIGAFTVCCVPYPIENESISSSSNLHLQNISPMTLSVSLGYIAHLVQMISIVINRPLRNPILHEGSKTRITDTVKDSPIGPQEFPLYTRSSIPSKMVKYAIYLLNQNIAQLCYDLTGQRCELRATIENILHIFKIMSTIDHNLRSVLPNSITGRSADDEGKAVADYITKSLSSVDITHDVLLLQTHGTTSAMQMSGGNNNLLTTESHHSTNTNRICRSVGSYSDCEDNGKRITAQCYSYSDSNIQWQDHV